jgi:hypothetical protein
MGDDKSGGRRRSASELGWPPLLSSVIRRQPNGFSYDAISDLADTRILRERRSSAMDQQKHKLLMSSVLRAGRPTWHAVRLMILPFVLVG